MTQEQQQPEPLTDAEIAALHEYLSVTGDKSFPGRAIATIKKLKAERDEANGQIDQIANALGEHPDGGIDNLIGKIEHTRTEARESADAKARAKQYRDERDGWISNYETCEEKRKQAVESQGRLREVVDRLKEERDWRHEEMKQAQKERDEARRELEDAHPTEKAGHASKQMPGGGRLKWEHLGSYELLRSNECEFAPVVGLSHTFGRAGYEVDWDKSECCFKVTLWHGLIGQHVGNADDINDAKALAESHLDYIIRYNDVRQVQPTEQAEDEQTPTTGVNAMWGKFPEGGELSGEKPTDDEPVACPWCGSEAVVDEEHANRVWVGCDGAGCLVCGPERRTREQAIAAWNRIAAPKPARPEHEVLREAADRISYRRYEAKEHRSEHVATLDGMLKAEWIVRDMADRIAKGGQLERGK